MQACQSESVVKLDQNLAQENDTAIPDSTLNDQHLPLTAFVLE